MNNTYSQSGRRPVMVAVMELGITPHLLAAAETAGLEPVVCARMRKGLAEIRRHRPRVVLAEFVFDNGFPNRISNFETLLAGLQKECPDARLVAVAFPEDRPHLEQLARRHPIHTVLFHPVDAGALGRALGDALAA